MARSGPAWSIKGVEQEVRDIARARAAGDDLNIGTWIDKIVLERVGGGAPASPPLDAVAGSNRLDQEFEREFLTFLEEELDRSKYRLDEVLKPIGFALRDLAVRLVAAEEFRKARTPAELISADGKLDPAAFATIPATSATPLEPPAGPVWPFSPSLDPSLFTAPRALGSVVHGSMAPTSSGPVEEPMVRGQELHNSNYDENLVKPTSHLGPPAPFAPTWSFGQVDPSHMLEPSRRPEPSPPIQSFAPWDFALPSPPMPKTASEEVEEDDPLAEVLWTKGERLLSALRVAAVILPVLVVTGLILGYLYAEQIGMREYRARLDGSVVKRADEVARSLRDFASEAVRCATNLPYRIHGEIDRLIGDWPQERPSSHTASIVTTAPVLPEGNNESERAEKALGPSGMASRAGATVKTEQPILGVGRTAMRRPFHPSLVEPAPVSGRSTVAKGLQMAAPPPPAPAVPSSHSAQSAGPSAIAESLERLARSGDAGAQQELGRRYLEGDGIAPDLLAASNWFREAAIQGLPNAQYNLGVLYERGQGLPRDDIRALLWYHSAAQQSHPLAQYNLGLFYLEGRGIPLSYTQAARWFTAAADQGIAAAAFNLAVLTEEGMGVERDKRQAVTLYKKAARAGETRARARLSLLSDSQAGTRDPTDFAETEKTKKNEVTAGTTVADIQNRLSDTGFYEGQIDGIAGPKTRAAIRAYQRVHALPETGIPSTSLLNYMRVFEMEQNSG